jgi:hypothetical protein
VESLSSEDATQMLGHTLIDDNDGDTDVGADEEA